MKSDLNRQMKESSLKCFFRIFSRILLYYYITILICLGNGTDAKLNPKRFPQSERVLIGKVSLKVAPLREYTFKAATTGLLELYVPLKTSSFKMGERLGGVDTVRLKLDQDLMDLSESIIKEKDIPQWHLQRKSQLDQLESQLSKIQSEASLAIQMIKNPKKYQELFKSFKANDKNQSQELEAYLNDLSIHTIQIQEMLSFVKSDRKEELELGELRKRLELKKLQFEMRLQDAYLTVPFDSEVEFLFPYVEGEKNYIQAGMEIALFRDLRELHGHVPILDPDWRLLEKSKLELELKSREGGVIGNYFKSLSKKITGGEELIYSFQFETKDNLVLRNHLGGRTEGKLYLRLPRTSQLIPKFLLVSLDPESFRAKGWSGLIKKVCPDYELLQVGLYSIAISKITKD